MKLFSKYTGTLRRFRFNYFIYNVIWGRKWIKPAAKHLIELGVKIPIYWRVQHRFLQQQEKKVEDYQPKDSINPNVDNWDQMVQEWKANGHITLTQFFNDDEVDAVNREVEGLLDDKVIDFNYTGKKVMDAWEKSEKIKSMAKNQQLKTVLSSLLGVDVNPFQTIYFQKGSEQHAHSDYIHMTTMPRFGLIAAWIALEDITEENGPLFYYSGSHLWDPLYSEDIGLKDSRWWLDENPNKKYEESIAKVIEDKGVSPTVYLPKKGDVLIWHSNLVHGGSPQLDDEASRKNLVVHFFAENAFCYHEISQRVALIKSF